MAAFYKFPSIENRRCIVSDVLEKFAPEGGVEVVGVNKLHGSNSAIVKHSHDGPITFQSRSRIITPTDDNSGFATVMTQNMDAANQMFAQIESIADLQYPIVVYGEWCGKGIQKGVALNEIDKMFVIFKIMTGADKTWLDMESWKEIQVPPLIRNIGEIPSYSFTLRKDHLQDDLDTIVKTVDEIDRQCPFAFKLFGIDGIGEGLVLRPKASEDPQYWWKVKGEGHQRSRPPPSKLASEKKQYEKEQAFAMKHVTYERLESAKEALHIKNDELIMKHFSGLSKWMISDIEREETFDVLERQPTTRASTGRLKERLK